MAHWSPNQYLDEVTRAMENQDGDLLADLIGHKHAHVASKKLQEPDLSHVTARFFDAPFDEMLNCHLRAVWAVSENNYYEAYQAHVGVVQNFMKVFQSQKEENWALPALYSACLNLRTFALSADSQRVSTGAGKDGEILEKSAEFLMNCFRVCVSDTRAAIENSKKWGMLSVVNQLFKIYFKINKLQLCKPLIRAIDALPIKDQFPKSHLVTYRFFVGKKAMFDTDYKLADDYLSYAFQHCHKDSQKNKRLILIYLLPVKMLLGKMPSVKLLKRFGLEPFIDIRKAVTTGNLQLLTDTLDKHQVFFIKTGTYLILEKLKILTYRNLFKKTSLILGNHQLPIEAFRIALHFMGETDIDTDEVHCILANLIYEGYIKGYISLQHQKLIISKVNPFPTINNKFIKNNIDKMQAANNIRKLRKKLRQIETLTRLDRELTPEEQYKVDRKDSLRKELQELLKEQEDMVTLTRDIKETTITSKPDGENEDKENRDTNMIEEDNKNLVDSQVAAEEPPEERLLGHTNVEEMIGVRDVNTEDTETSPVSNTVHTPSQEKKSYNLRSEPTATATTTSGNALRGDKAASKNTVTSSNPPISTTVSNLFKDMNFKVSLLEGHHHDVCAVDFHDKFVVSGGRDTSLKIWDSSSYEEVKSMGGHEATITAVCFMRDRPYDTIPSVITACYDCSLRTWNMDEGKMTKSIYVYSPVTCLDYSNGCAAIGTEGGKVELYEVESGSQIFSVNAFEDFVTVVKIMRDGKVVCGSYDGLLKIFDPSGKNKTPVFSLDPDSISVKTIAEASNGHSEANNGVQSPLNLVKINCLEVWNDLVIYGDGGYNLKVLDYNKGQLTKVRNNLKEFCPTEALSVKNIGGHTYLTSVGSDVDTGDSYINVRSLPTLHYLGTIRDDFNNSGSITSLSLHETPDKLISMVTAGQQLRVWKQVRRGKKRKGSVESFVIPCKYIRTFTDTQHSEPESDNETDQEESDFGNHSSGEMNKSTTVSPSGYWCSIL